MSEKHLPTEEHRHSSVRPGAARPVRTMLGRGHHPIGALAEKPKDFKGTLQRLLRYLRPYRLRLLLVVTLAALSTVSNIFSPKIMGRATTKLFEGLMMKYQHIPGAKIDFAYIREIIIILIGLYAASAFLSYLQQFLMAEVAQRIVFDMRRDVYEKLNRLPLSFFDSRPHGEIMSRVTNDIDNISTTLQQSLTQLIVSLCAILGVIIMMLTISPLLTAITLATLPLSFSITRAIAKRSQGYFASQQKELGILNGYVEETYTGHQIVKAFGKESNCIAKFRETNEKLYEASWKAQFVSGVIFPLMNFVNNLGYVLICVAGGIMVTRHKIAIGDVQAFIQYSRQFTQPIAQTANIANVFQSTIASAERVFEILEETEETPDPADAKTLLSPRGEVALENVRFGYQPGALLLEDINLHVKPGQTVAIVGPTGAGKTTLVNLLMRFYEIWDGKITVDGINTREMKRENLRQIFGMVLQDTWLFNGTIKDNIAYGREGASMEEIVEAAKTAHAHHFIMTLPEGYETVINEEATNISSGQKQLLTIARAFLARPAILILDEATSSVDTRTEIHIQKAMQKLMYGKTSFVIAHRLSTIRDADLILVMDRGRIVETGRHHELLARGGFYAELYNSQFSAAAAE